MGPDYDERTRAEVRDAYTSVTRLRVYTRLTLLVSVTFFLASLGGIVVGWLPVDEGVLALASAALIGLASAAKFYDASHRTTLYAMDLERGLPGEENLDPSTMSAQSIKTLTAIAAMATALVGAGILGYSFAHAGSQQPITSLSQAFVTDDERDDDDDDDDNGDEREDGAGDADDTDSGGDEDEKDDPPQSDDDTGEDSETDGSDDE